MDGRVLRVIGARDGFVEVAPVLDTEQQHCERPLHGEEFDVRLFVSPWSLVTVITREVHVEFDDGSSITLRPGAVVQPIVGDPAGRYAVATGGVRLRLELPEDAVGSSYEAGPVFAPGFGSRQGPPNVTEMTFDGEEIMHLDPALSHQLSVQEVSKEEAGYRTTVQGDCLRVTGLAATDPVMEHDDFETIDFGLGGPAVVVPNSTVIPVSGLAEPASDDVIEIDLVEVEAMMELVETMDALDSDEIAAIESSFGSGIIEGLVAPSLPGMAWVFEQGSAVFVSEAGPAAGVVVERRVFMEEGARPVGSRVCFATAFGGAFFPPLSVCLDASEGHFHPALDPALAFAEGEVVPGPISLTGAQDEVAVARALRFHRQDLHRCYNEALDADPMFHGALVLALGIDGEGTVTHVMRRGGPFGPAVGCAMESARKWTMPATTDGRPATVQFEVELTTE